MLENLNKIQVDNPVDLIIDQIRKLITSGAIESGDKLPPERKLAEYLEVSRGQVREAINKLQFYGIVKVVPQRGTLVSGIGIVALEGLITDILKSENSDFTSLLNMISDQNADGASKAMTSHLAVIKDFSKNYYSINN